MLGVADDFPGTVRELREVLQKLVPREWVSRTPAALLLGTNREAPR